MRSIRLVRVTLFKTLYILAFVGALCVEGDSATSSSPLLEESSLQRDLIIGGEIATSGDYPYFVHYSSPGCGGALIAPDIVLTAGHCMLSKPSSYGIIYVGRYNSENNADKAQAFRVVSHSRHPDFDDEVCCGKSGGTWFYGVHNDFMLFKLSGSSTNTPIKLNTSNLRPVQGQELHVIGFGDTDPGNAFVEPDRLHEVTVNYMTNSRCIASSIYPSELLTSASMCASDDQEDACSGDSGGPLIIKGVMDSSDVLVGVVSWGWECAIEPGVYARVSVGYSWIRGEVCRLSSNPPASFGCPTPKPTPLPTAVFTETPSNSPTLAPATTPSFLPTLVPTTKPSPMPSKSPTFSPSLNPTSIPSAQFSQEPTVARSSNPTSTPSRAHTQQPTIAPTLYPTMSEMKIPEMGFTENPSATIQTLFPTSVTTSSSPNDIEELGNLTLVRRSLPSGKACHTASISPLVCCSSISNSILGIGENCVPTSTTFNDVNDDNTNFVMSGMLPCTEETSTLSTVSTSTSSSASLLSQWRNVHNNNNNQSDGMDHSSLSICEQMAHKVASSRMLLPSGMSCDQIPSKEHCCQYLDNRHDQEGGNNSSYYHHHQPCVPLRKLPNDLAATMEKGRGICEPANWVAEIAPEWAYDCDALTEHDEMVTTNDWIVQEDSTAILSSSSLSMEDSIEGWLPLEKNQSGTGRSIVFQRTELPSGYSCQNITDPILCCFASNNNQDERFEVEEYGGNDCFPLLLENPICATAVGLVNRSEKGGMDDLYLETGGNETTIIEMTTTTTTTTTTTAAAATGMETNEDEDRSNICNMLIQKRRQIQLSGGQKNCSSMASPRSCCHAVDENNIPCLPIRLGGHLDAGKGNYRCESADWIIANAPNSIILDCTSQQPEQQVRLHS